LLSEDVSFISLGVVLYFLNTIIEDLDKDTIHHIKMAMIIIFVYRAMPSVGPEVQWWQIDVLGFDARHVAMIDTALASPFDYIAGVLMLTLVAIYAPEGKKGTWFALMASLMNIAMSAGRLFTKYLNQAFEITREIKEGDVVVTQANYSELGTLLWIVIIVGFIVPIVTILIFDPKVKMSKE